MQKHLSFFFLARPEAGPKGGKKTRSETCQDPAAYRFEPLLGSFMNQLVGDSQIAPSSQAVGSRAVADVSAAWTPPVPALPHLMDVLSHPDVQAGPTPEPPALATHDALCGVVARAVRLLINSLLPVITDRLRLASCSICQVTSPTGTCGIALASG